MPLAFSLALLAYLPLAGIALWVVHRSEGIEHAWRRAAFPSEESAQVLRIARQIEAGQHQPHRVSDADWPTFHVDLAPFSTTKV